MTTVQQVIDGAAEEIFVKTSESALESEDFQMFLDRLNDLGAEWADIGLTPRFIEVSDSTDTVQIDRNAVRALKLNLAIACASTFNKQVTPALAANADSSLSRLRASILRIGPVALPDTMPIGSGNECGTFESQRFFPQNKTDNF